VLLDDLVSLSAGGDRDAFARLFDTTVGRVRREVAARLPEGAHVDRVLENIYLELWQTAAGFRRIDRDPARWILRVAHTHVTAARLSLAA
jgi:RNA polymerase sigma-70 factor, ECF subfamily